MDALRSANFAIWTTDLSQHAESLAAPSTATLPPRLAICFGTELAGASQQLLAAADKRVCESHIDAQFVGVTWSVSAGNDHSSHTLLIDAQISHCMALRIRSI